MEFGTVLNASGARGFFGETPNFNWGRQSIVDWKGSTFVAKTVTLSPHRGNLKVAEEGITSVEEYPACIVVDEERQQVINAVGLTGPGVRAVMERGKWQGWNKPFFLSFMAVAETPELRIEETRQFVEIMKEAKPQFDSVWGLQINFSCPNTDLDIGLLVSEIEQSLSVCSELGVALVPKVSLVVPVVRMMQIMESPHCDALCLTNSMPVDAPDSPLSKLGGGGLSGKPLFAPMVACVEELVGLHATKPIIAGGGILSPEDARELLSMGASSVSLGSVSILAPDRVAQIITQVQKVTL